MGSAPCNKNGSGRRLWLLYEDYRDENVDREALT